MIKYTLRNLSSYIPVFKPTEANSIRSISRTSRPNTRSFFSHRDRLASRTTYTNVFAPRTSSPSLFSILRFLFVFNLNFTRTMSAGNTDGIEKSKGLVSVEIEDHHQKAFSKPVVAKFGTVLGIASGNCPVYSCDYKSADKKEYPNRESFIMNVDGEFTGYKWQCVEIARRWLLLNKGYVFDSIPMAFDIFDLETVRVIKDQSTLPLKSFKNGALRRPEIGCMLIWKEGGEFRVTGHVAIVTGVSDSYVQVIEQNVLDEVWPPGQNYSRQLTAHIKEDGGFWVDENYFEEGDILGWVIQTDDPLHAVVKQANTGPKIRRETCPVPENVEHITWLDENSREEVAWAEMNGRCECENFFGPCFRPRPRPRPRSPQGR